MNNKLANLGHLHMAAEKAQALTAQVASAAAAAIEELDEAKQEKLTGTAGQVVGFDATGKPVAQGTDSLRGPKGDAGAAAGFGTPTASVDANVGTPSVTVTATGTDTAKAFNFAFKNLKGATGNKGDKGDQGLFYGTCATAAATAEKVATLAGFTLTEGAVVAVKFTYANTASSPTLNVNGTGAKSIKKYGTTASMAYMWQAGEMVEFVYDGTNWVMVEGGLATTTYYGVTKLSSSVSSTSTDLAATPSAVKQAYDLANGKQDKLTGSSGQVVGFDASGAALAVRGWSNQNILDNWYFPDPVNQRGISEKTFTSMGYHIDRWVANRVTLKLVDGGLSIARSSGDNGFILQRIEPKLLSGYVGRTATISVLADGQLYSFTFTIVAMPSGTDIIYIEGNIVDNLRIDFEANVSSKTYNVVIRTFTSTPKIFKAIKLELGPDQTLAHKEGNTWMLNDPPPNKALELEKCMRYQFVPSTGQYLRYRVVHAATDYLEFCLPIPTTLRAKPTLFNTGRLVIASTANSVVDGFIFSCTGYGRGALIIVAAKSGHGLTDAQLLIAPGDDLLIFDSNL